MKRRSLISIADLDRAEIARILRVGNRFAEVMRRDIKKVPTLRGRTIINMFFEASTRTSTSFELAGKRLSADVVNVKGSGSSVEKGETLKDTVLTLASYAPDVLVIRHHAVGACQSRPATPTRRSSTPGTASTSTPPRRCWTSTPSSARSAPSTGCTSPSGRHRALPGGAVGHPRLPDRRRAGVPDRPADPDPARRRAGPRRAGLDRRARHRRRRRGLRAAHAARADGPGRLRPLAARVRRHLRHRPLPAAAGPEGDARRP